MTRDDYQSAVKADLGRNFEYLISSVTVLAVRDAQNGDPDAAEYLQACCPDLWAALSDVKRRPTIWMSAKSAPDKGKDLLQMPVKTAKKRKITTSLPARVLESTGDAVSHRRLGQEIDAAFQERDELRTQNARLEEQIAALRDRLAQELKFHHDTWALFHANAGQYVFIGGDWAQAKEPELLAN